MESLEMAKRGKAIRQAAVIAVRDGRICLITSSSGKRWLVPKGNLEQGAKLQETAIQEAWEEAGLVGTLKANPVGSYRMEKLGRVYQIVVFRMKVAQVKRDWPERNRRQRRWFRPSEALTLIDHARLRKLISAEIGERKAA
jgi:8-oxo-dGTP pyrophosphatase MutT (NUDIX family)